MCYGLTTIRYLGSKSSYPGCEPPPAALIDSYPHIAQVAGMKFPHSREPSNPIDAEDLGGANTRASQRLADVTDTPSSAQPAGFSAFQHPSASGDDMATPAISPVRNENFPERYQQVIRAADLAEHSGWAAA